MKVSLGLFLLISSWFVQAEYILGQELATPALQISEPAKLSLEAPTWMLSGVPFEIRVRALNASGDPDSKFSGQVTLTGVTVVTQSGEVHALQTAALDSGHVVIQNAILANSGAYTIVAEHSGKKSEANIRVIPGVLSLLPPLLAIALAFITREVLISLLAGIWLGALFIFDYNPLTGFIRTLDTYLRNALADPDHAAIILFSMTLGGMVGVISKAGGTQGIVEKLAKYAKNSRGGQLASWAMGVLIFFDDYANSLIVGNTMRPFTDRLKISREKLSYIVDSTAAPVASIAFISTWVGFQVGLIDQASQGIGLSQNAYQMFLASIPYSTYSILALLFVFLVGLTLRDFGPMRTAEQRALNSGKVLRDGAQPLTDSSALDMVADDTTPLRWYNALIPIAVVIVGTFIGLYLDGRASLAGEAVTAPLGKIFGAANSFPGLLWAAFAGLLAACFMAMSQRILTLKETVAATVNGYKSMLLACMILVLAWAIGDICGDLHTADYVIAMTKGSLSPHLIPFITFVLAAFIAFSTGTSWATMAILTPLVVPIAFQFPTEAGLSTAATHNILIATIGSVLSGAVLGDHCSPISDTTILSSMASAADHVDHVRTQLPYALTVACVASLVGYIPSGWGLHPAISLALGAGILIAVILILGKKSPGSELPKSQTQKAINVQ